MKKRICIIGPSLKMGGVEKESSNVANILSVMNYKVIYLAIFRQPRFFKLNEKVIFEEPSYNTPNLKFIKTIMLIRSRIKKFNPDAILVYHNIYSALTLIALIGLKYPVFIRDVGSPLNKWPWKMNIFFRAVFYLISPNGVLAQTNIGAKIQHNWFKKGVPIKVIHNPLYPMVVPNAQRKNYVLAVGRFNDPLKGFDRLIEAFAMLKNNNSWKLVFAGGNEDGEELKEQARTLGILENIIFLGKVKDMAAVYGEAKIFVIPSRSEGLPNALCEAMSAGLACVAFDFISGPRDLIKNGYNGIIVENDNILALSNAIQELIEYEDKRVMLGNKAKEINKKLAPIKIGKEIEDFIINQK